MQWTMPRRVLQIVASLIVLAAAASFVMGVIHSPQRGGRLPGEKAAGAADATAPIEATDATPLTDERIQGAAQAAANSEAKNDEKTSEADAGNSDDDEDVGPAAPAGNAAAPVVKLPPVPAGEPPPQTLGGPPASDEPPH